MLNNKIYWFTGQPGSGKTTLAKELENRLNGILFDGDEIRNILGNTSNELYSTKNRYENSKFITNLVRVIFIKCNQNIIVSTVSPFRELRERLKKDYPVIEIYCHTQDIRGKEKYFIKNYEKPLSNFIDINTSELSIKEAINEILPI